MNSISPADASPSINPPMLSTAPRAAQRPYVASTDLLGGSREMIIQHGDHEYRLRLTQNDKLILTK